MLRNFLNHNLKELMAEEERVTMAREWLDLMKTVNYPLSAKRQIVGLAQLMFGNAINAKYSKLDDAGDPDDWFPILKEAVILATDPEHSDIVYLNTLKSSYDKLVNNGQYKLAFYYAEEFISYYEKSGSTNGANFGSDLFSEIQKLKHSGKGDPNAEILLRKLAKIDHHSSILIQHI